MPQTGIELFDRESPLHSTAESCLLRADLYRRIGDFKPASENRVFCEIAATHYGFKADASEVGGELERIIDDVPSHPAARLD